MKKKYSPLLLVFLIINITGCDFMDEIPYYRIDSVAVFSSSELYERPTNQAYSFIRNGFSRIDGAFLEAATDNGTTVVYGSKVNTIAQGSISSSNVVDNCWESSYKGIHQSLYAIEGYEKYPLKIKNQTEEEIKQVKAILTAELNALRALYELDLLRYYGGYVIMDKTYDLYNNQMSEEMRNLKRSSFADCVEHIVDLCDKAAEVLALQPRGENGGYGRMTKGAAKAIKAKALIYAASPLYNRPGNTDPLLGYTDGSDVTLKWQRAAEACKDVIFLKAGNANRYSLHANYEKLFVIQPNNNKEYIVTCNSEKGNGLEKRQYPPSVSVLIENNGGGTVPSQEFVDAFTNADGTDFVRTDESAAKQYEKRDPRLNLSVIYNGADFANFGSIYTKRDETNRDGLNSVMRSSTTTGYYLRKFLDTAVDFNSASPATAYHYYPIIRLADVLLMYAEAMTMGYGIDVDPKGWGLTAKAAVTQVRKRAGFNNNDKYLAGVTTPEQMMDKIKLERRIELSFEEHRYFDLRRWMDAENYLNKSITGVAIETIDNTDEYSYFTVDNTRTFTPKMYYHPIPLDQTKALPGVTQNPGW